MKVIFHFTNANVKTQKRKTNFHSKRPVLDRFHDSGRQSWDMCQVIVKAYNPSAKPILWVKFISAFLTAETIV